VQLLAKNAATLGLRLTPPQLDKFRAYADELILWNQRFNLTAIAEPEQIQLKHFLDSLSLLLVWRPSSGATVLDVGAGAGFPGLPLKIVAPQIRLTLVEATSKKVDFLNHVIAQLGLEGATALHARAEDLGHQPAHRERYDLVLARAVAALPELLEYTLPFATLGGTVVVHKGAAAQQEAQDAAQAFSILGGSLDRIVPVELPGVTEERQLVVVRKTALTPANYPRRAGVPHKRPLGVQSEAPADAGV
jgi:16S rRNA (guanine527-N7)-methyltransferase